MVEIIPSRYMREYFKKVGFELTDSQKATVIWELNGFTWEERLDSLAELGEHTEDKKLKKQIEERIEFEEKRMDAFFDNSERKFIYNVTDEDGCSCGCFAAGDMAIDYARSLSLKNNIRHQVEKMPVIPDVFDEEKTWRVSEVTLDEKGRISYFCSNEYRDEEFPSGEDRFEDRFFEIPFDMPMGCTVKNIVYGDYFVLTGDKETWDSFLRRVREGDWQLEYWETAVVVYSIEESGKLDHWHMNPLLLEPEMPPEIPGDTKREALIEAFKAVGSYFASDKQSLPEKEKAALECLKKYADICSDEKKANFDNIKKLRDIMG